MSTPCVPFRLSNLEVLFHPFHYRFIRIRIMDPYNRMLLHSVSCSLDPHPH